MVALEEPISILEQPRSWVDTSEESFFFQSQEAFEELACLLTGTALKILPRVTGKPDAERARVEVAG